jgi:multimeric flavodoxin WrbA
MRKILVVMGSPRAKGNSSTLARQVIAGAEEAGAQVESYVLQDMDIRPCNACDACLRDPDRGCVIEDDMQDLYPRFREADAIVIASPIYWFTVSAQTKAFLDRWYAFEGLEENPLKGKQLGIVLAYGDSDPFNSGAVNALRMYQDACRYVGAHIAGAVYGSASKPGEIAKNQALMDKAYRLGERLGTGA